MVPLLLALMLMASFSEARSEEHHEAPPVQTTGQHREEASGFQPPAGSACPQWTDGCQVCIRSASGGVSCSTAGIACIQTVVACVPETGVAK